MADLTPRRLTATDQQLPPILTLLRAEFAFMDGRIDPPSSLHRATLETLRDQADEQEIWALGSPPFACVFLTKNANCLYLGKLAVARHERGKGHARTLVKLAVNRTRDLGFGTLQLDVRIELTENQAAFMAMGFTKVGETAHDGYDRPTSYSYVLDVT